MQFHETPEQAPRRGYRQKDLERIYGISGTTIWRMRKRRELPEPIQISPGVNIWTPEMLADFEARKASNSR
jgi:predicted DNA-binding transcriptional regulator AlpA